MAQEKSVTTIAGAGTAERLQTMYGISESDLARVRRYGDLVLPRIDEFVTTFYQWMETLPEFAEYFSSPQKLASVQEMQRQYWREFFHAQLDDAYVTRCRAVGEAHARIGLSLDTYFAAMSVSLDILTTTLYEGGLEPSEHAATVTAITRLLHFDTSIVVNTFAARTQWVIGEQSETLMQMSTPVTQIWDGILLLPLVGIVDSKRSRDVMNAMLETIEKTRARSIILDIGGVAVVDTAVANHLIKITKATMLMGCECTISGISPAIAQTVVELGIEVGDIRTTATLGDALEYAFERTGVEIRGRDS
jgi:rsbT co-antagonist protein RsbR